MAIEVVALNLVGRLAMLENGQLCQIAGLFDEWGDETDDVTETVRVIVKVSNELWMIESISDYDTTTKGH